MNSLRSRYVVWHWAHCLFMSEGDQTAMFYYGLHLVILGIVTADELRGDQQL